MKKIIEIVKSQFTSHKAFLLYGFISVLVTVIDIIICRVCELWLPSVAANTIGVVTGFTVQYFLTARHVYNTNNIKSFIVFLWTFFVGLIFANAIVYTSRTYIFGGADSSIAFLTSKALSIIFPFFLMYFLRKKFMPTNETKKEQ